MKSGAMKLMSTIMLSGVIFTGMTACKSTSGSGQGITSLLSKKPDLEVRNITVGMTHDQVLAAAKVAQMNVLVNQPDQIKAVDPTASGRPTGGASAPGGNGLILLINFKDAKSVSVMISEQGDMQGHVFDDLSKKWGKPDQLPSGFDSELGGGEKATWGDRKTVYAEYNSSIYSFGGQNVTIYDAQALAPKVEPRKAPTM
jgi:hypothetical protein